MRGVSFIASYLYGWSNEGVKQKTGVCQTVPWILNCTFPWWKHALLLFGVYAGVIYEYFLIVWSGIRCKIVWNEPSNVQWFRCHTQSQGGCEAGKTIRHRRLRLRVAHEQCWVRSHIFRFSICLHLWVAVHCWIWCETNTTGELALATFCISCIYICSVLLIMIMTRMSNARDSSSASTSFEDTMIKLLRTHMKRIFSMYCNSRYWMGFVWWHWKCNESDEAASMSFLPPKLVPQARRFGALSA